LALTFCCKRKKWACAVLNTRHISGRWGRRHKQLLGDLKEKRGYWKLKDKALHRTLWRLALEKAINLSLDRLQNEWNKWTNERTNERTNEWMNEWIWSELVYFSSYNLSLVYHLDWYIIKKDDLSTTLVITSLFYQKWDYCLF
jgi:hypothetical protein